MPLVLVEIEEIAAFVLEHRVDPGHERVRRVAVTRQVPPDDVVRDGEELAVWAVAVLHPRLLADPAHPLVSTGRRVSGLAGLSALEAAGVDVVSTTEEGAEQRDLRGRGGVAIYGWKYDRHPTPLW